ncbi:hypothetical protein BSKO_08139 [Bryopsis sp. KO-2023]|nr:hypothetical protein BSKO_08139 [Bryopsis sp. KO-2023]
MGVRHMASFLRSQCYQRVDLRNFADSENENVLVFDVLGCSDRYIWRNTLIWDFEDMLEKVMLDVNAFRKAGFELLVVLDAGVDDDKIGTWIKRRKMDLKAVQRLNESTIREEIPRNLQVWHSPLSCVEYLNQAFRRAGCRVYFANGEADHEAAWLAVSEQACGVLTCDTDFLMYCGIKRYFDSQTIEFDEEGGIYVEMVDKGLLLETLGLTESQLPAIAGVCGNDVLNGQPQWIAKHVLENADGVAKFEAAVTKLGSMSEDAWCGQCQKAISHYTPIEPSPQTSQHLLTFILRTRQVFVRGVSTGSLKQRSVHKVLGSLRRAAYARLGLRSVHERVCCPQDPPSKWLEGDTIQLNESQPRVPDIPSDPVDVVVMACGFLFTCGALEEFHCKALVLQIQDRSRLLEEMDKRESACVPTLDDVHAAMLFLEAVECLCIGQDRRYPMCWELFHGPLFHCICHDRQLVNECNLLFGGFDWGPVVSA